MKNRLLVVGIMVLAVALPLVPAAALCAPSQPAAEKQPAGDAPAIGVNALMRSPDSHKGTIRVRGVVTSVFPKEQRLGLVDAVYLNCCSSPCASIQAMPVKWTGEMPPAKSLVMVTGEVRRTGEKLEFVAEKIDGVPPSPAAQ